MTYKKQLEKRVLAGLLAGAALWLGMPAALAASGAVPNTQLPQGGSVMAGNASIGDPNNGQLTITQGSQNAVIQWGGGFNVGANATVNFEKGKDYSGTGNFNTLNYDASGNMSQIYGAINAQEGNIYIVNPAGVEISSSAQINVGSLYVSNKKMADDVLRSIDDTSNITNLIQSQAANTNADAVLMSLGNINADHVTFDGGRIVIDTERLKTDDAKMDAKYIHVRTTDAGQVVLGYDGYDESSKEYGTTKAASELASVTDGKGNAITDLKGYMWVEDIEQLQAVNTNLSGQYALRNSIDATATKDGGFKPIIGKDDTAFTGKFDGLDYNIFNLNINRNTDNVGLFSVVGNGAVIRNVTLVGGSITGGSNVGALAGQVSDNAQISNITNSASVTGSSSNVGGIIGSAGDSVFENLVNTGTVAGTAENTENNAGGLIGSLSGGTLSGTSYNLGGVTGKGSNVGGLVGKASDAALGDGTNLIYNRLNVSGLYNVGGIVGSMENTTVQNAENSGNVTAAGYTTGDYKYHTAHTFNDGNVVNGVRTEKVNIANAGGIAGTAYDGSEISNVQNSGDVSSSKQDGNGYYDAGNVGGIVGSAVDTNISDATNEGNDIRGAHNVGGIAGYFGSTDTENTDVTYTITRGINSGGNIMATGARNEKNNGFVTEWVRDSGEDNKEAFNIGNMGGIAGYLDGDNVYIVSGANRGTVHTAEFTGTVPDYAMAANAGGIVGKIDRSHTLDKDGLGPGYANAAVSNSYNTGDVMGYTGVGGVAGMMYNGEIAGSYNLGYISTTRQNGEGEAALNMGGIVGDTTEEGNATALLYDVYNKGQIGDETFTYYARHVGGIVGRLSGTVEKAYNTGAIYNGSNVVGGIAGWMYKGSITNSFNTGNITVLNRNEATSQVGGIVGAANLYAGDIVLKNIYNLGTLRSFKNGSGENSIGGIIGEIFIYGDYGNPGNLKITNAYTLGNIYSDTNYTNVHPMLGQNSTKQSGNVRYTNTYYIQPEITSVFENLKDKETDVTSIAYADRHNKDVWDFSTTGADDNGFSSQEGGKVTIESGEDWRIYDGVSLPILNAFLPNTEDYFDQYESDDALKGAGISSIQYGTAYDPLLTIINANTNTDSLTFDWKELGISNAAGLAVYGANLTLNDFMVSGGSGYFGGMIYSDGALAINAHTDGETHNSENKEVTGDVALGSASQLYGSSVTISADGNVTIYGNVTATGNTKNGATGTDNAITDKNSGDISITGGSVDIYGQLISAKKDAQTTVPGIGGKSDTWSPTSEDVSDYTKPMTDIGDRFGYTTGTFTGDKNGDISITASGKASEDGHVNVYYGRQQKGFLDTAGDLTVSASGDVYMDSDLSIGGSLSITAGTDSEAVLDISNIGQVQATEDKSAVAYLHDFLTHFATKQITLSGGKQKIAVDMWTDNAFDLDKFDLKDASGTVMASLADKLNALNINGSTDHQGQKYTYIWVSTGEELKNIQTYYEANKGNTHILSYNFALKNDIDASAVKDYVAIGTGSDNGFTGTFDGRDNRIIGLKVDTLSDGTAQSNAGIFNTIGTVENKDGTKTVGKVEDLRVYSGTFNGTDNAGAVAGINNGTISNVTTFGNVVTAENKAAGGIAGDNFGAISNASASDAVTDKKSSNAGGIAGINEEKAVISDSSSNSAVSSKDNALGGIAGVNSGTLSNVDSLGVTTGIYKGTSTRYSDNVGGIAGRNSGTVSNAYNESIVSGRDNVGGILGTNTGKNVENVSNAARVTGEAASDDTSDYVGGLVGSNSGSITNGRNNGEITGNQYVGGLVGENGKDSTLSNLVNDEAASITGDNYVGGIAGSNAGYISSENQKNLVNRGSITGQMYVGGVAGENVGKIEYVKSDIDLHVRDTSAEAKYFGGVAGINGGDKEGGSKGTITNATNSANVIAINADYVGGIVGRNTKNGILSGAGNSNEGRVEGKSYVGGVAGLNDAEIAGTLGSMIGIKNSGVVIAHEGGAGGIFGENKGNITYVEMTNNGIVTGTDGKGTGLNGTGGIFGVNSGTVTHSSLKNQVNGQVIGTQNVGGLIGVNTGTITGGRTETDGTDVGYYKYQIYNNGTITVGMWTDGSDKNGIIDDGEITTDGISGSNIGGLVGLNGSTQMDDGSIKTGSITAGYNTGAIMAGGSTNVGGIAGTNTGKLDQVFNTVITGVGTDGSTQYGSITGGTNVGGIVGSNETGSTVSNAYNTSDIIGTDTIGGAIAGTNNGTISNVYGTGSGNLVNTGTEADHVYQNSKDGFGEGGSSIDKTGEASASTVPWRQYGDKDPLLKVFLTTVKYDASKNDQNLVYNGKEQTLNVTGSGFTATDSFAAHNNVSGGLIYHDVAGEHKNAGTYTDNLWSEQIKAGSTDDTFNPNNLGYDVQSVEYKINKATLDVTLSDIYRQYGNSDMYTDEARTSLHNDYTKYWTISVGNRDDFDQDVLKNDLAQISSTITDGGAADGTNGRVTANAGKHDWSVKVDISAISQNYQLKDDTSASEHIYKGTGQSHVAKADLTITAKPETIYVGGTPHYTGTVNSFVNGDSFNISFGVEDSSIESTVGTYAGKIGFRVDGNFYLTGGWENLFGGNYNIKFTPGTLTVKDLPSGMPDIPDSEKWNSLLRDTPWDRNGNFRERKAEIHFIAGGMSY